MAGGKGSEQVTTVVSTAAVTEVGARGRWPVLPPAVGVAGFVGAGGVLKGVYFPGRWHGEVGRGQGGRGRRGPQQPGGPKRDCDCGGWGHAGVGPRPAGHRHVGVRERRPGLLGFCFSVFTSDVFKVRQVT